MPWAELVDGLREACAALDAVLATAAARPTGETPAATARAILILPPGPAPTDVEAPFAAELGWAEYAFVLRLHLLDHRTQVRQLRTALAGRPAR